MKKLVALLTVAALVGLGTVAYAACETQKQKEILEVTSWKGKHIGIVHNVVMNLSTGNVTFVILCLDKQEKKEIAVPLAAFSSFDRENGILTLSVSEKELVLAPEFHDSDLKDPDFAERVHRFFGRVPPWTEEQTEGEERL